MKSICAWSSNELQRLKYMTGSQDQYPQQRMLRMDMRGNMPCRLTPHFQKKNSYTSIHSFLWHGIIHILLLNTKLEMCHDQMSSWCYRTSHKILTQSYSVLVCFSFANISLSIHLMTYHIIQGSFTATGAIIRLPQCQWSNPEGYGLKSTDIQPKQGTTMCIILRIYCT